jgi:hypothetical protein
MNAGDAGLCQCNHLTQSINSKGNNWIDFEYVLELAISYNEESFALIVGALKKKIGSVGTKAMIQKAVDNFKQRTDHSDHECPTFFLVRKLANQYLGQEANDRLCDRCGQTCEANNHEQDLLNLQKKMREAKTW